MKLKIQIIFNHHFKFSIFSEKRKAERERKKLKAKKSKVKKVVDTTNMNGNKSPVKEVVSENGKVIFNKFDLIIDPLEAEKERLKVSCLLQN